MDIQGPLPNTSFGNQHVFVYTECYTKLTRAILVTKVSRTYAASIFVDRWVILYGAATYLLTNIEPKLFSNSLAAVCGCLQVPRLTTTAYHPQTNDQVERSSKAIVTGLCHNVAEHMTSSDQFDHPFMYAYNAQGHRSTGTKSFSLVLPLHPPGPNKFDPSLSISTDVSTPPEPHSFHKRFLRKLATLRIHTNRALGNG